jgi:hypothetical protein
MFTSKNLKRCLRSRFGTRTLLAVLVAGTLRSSFAGNATEPSFPSPEEAAQALYKTVESDDQATLSELLGPLSSSGDEAQDKADRQLFIQKYSEMHRLVKEPDGSIVLYIGAENWPFPAPLVSKNGRWRFDVDAGAQEIFFRRIGENETTAIETCRAIARAVADSDSNTDDNSVNTYVQKLVGAANEPDAFHGYYFRLLRTPNGASVIAYPAEYGSTGVMTFAVTTEGPVYEKDLGPSTSTVAKSLKAWKPNASWQVAQ